MGREACASLEALNGAMRLLDAAKLEPGVRLHLAALRRAASGLAAQLAHAVDYDAIERGQVRVRPQRTEVLALVREVASQSAAEAADRRVAFALFAPQHPIPGMVVDPSRLRQVADALVRDAIARTRDGEVGVELRREREAAGSEQGWLSLYVTDDGPDPAPGAAARTQAALDGDVPVPARDVGGIDAEAVVGVAMWRAARITKALGGTLQLRATPGAGVRRELRLPVRFDPSASTRGALLEDLNAGFARPTLAAGGATRGVAAARGRPRRAVHARAAALAARLRRRVRRRRRARARLAAELDRRADRGAGARRPLAAGRGRPRAAQARDWRRDVARARGGRGRGPRDASDRGGLTHRPVAQPAPPGRGGASGPRA